MNKKLISKFTGLLAILAFLSLGATPATAATFEFSPATATLTQGCYNSVDIDIDVTGEVSNAADIEITYNPTQINIIDSDPNIAGTQIRTGNAYEAYFSNRVDASAGRILLAAGSFVGTLSSRRILASIEMTAPAATTTSFTIRFEGVGATLDSNIADASTSNDLLTSVTNGTYTFTTGSCATDSQSPQAQLIDPQPYESDVPADSNIVVRITDNQSGVDLSSLRLIINGVTYVIGDPQVTYTGAPEDYTFTIDPVDDLPNAEASTVGVSGQDLAGNQFSQQFVFNLPPEIVPPSAGGSTTVCENPGQALTSYIQQTVGSNQVLNVLTTTGFSLGFLQALTVLNTPGLLYNFLAFFLGKKRDKTWGTVTDAASGKPIPFAACRLFIEGTLSIQQQTVSDTEGRYGFSIQSGRYRLEVKQSGYETCTRTIVIESNESSHVYDIKLNPEGLSQNYAQPLEALWDRFKVLYFKLRNYVFLIGLALAIFSVLVTPTILNIVIFGFYTLIIILLGWGQLTRKPKSAAVIDAQTNLRIPFAHVKIFDPTSWELVDSQVTNANGNFDFWGKPGEYALLVDVRGYTFPSSKQRNYPVVKDKYSPMLKIDLAQGYNHVQIYVDPIESTSFQSGTGQITPTPATNLSNPFD